MFPLICQQLFKLILLAPIVVSGQDYAIALNSPTAVTAQFINVNGLAAGTAITVNAGEKLSVKCSVTGNPDQYSTWAYTWSWEFATGYTELTGCTGCTLNNPQPMSSTNG